MSESSSAATTETNNTQIDARKINDASGGGFINEGQFNQNNTTFNSTTDYGAVAAGSAVAATALSANQSVTGWALDNNRVVSQSALAANTAVSNKAIDAAITAQQQSFSASATANAQAFNFARSAQGGAFASVDKAINAVVTAYNGAKGDANASSEIMKFAVGGVIVVAAASIIFRK